MKRILFVCLGNICRSPTAESIFRKLADSMANGDSYEFDSAGTANYHIGDASDPRSIKHAKKRGYEMNHIGRQLTIQDFDRFDLILVMDQSNHKNALSICPEPHKRKIKLVTDYCVKPNPGFVPDPYLGTESDFELVIDILEDAAQGFLATSVKVPS